MVIVYIFLFLVFLWFGLDFYFGNREKYGIIFVAGEIGCGKSCYAVKQALCHIKKGWKVYTNFYLEGCYKFSPSDLVSMCAPEKSLIIFDEASLDMNSREFKKISMDLIYYYKMSRHYKNKIILISQTFTDTDKQIRDLSTKVLFIRKLIHSLFSMPVNVKGSLDIGEDGQPTVKYKIGKIGLPYILPRYYKYFNSFDKKERSYIEKGVWGECPENPLGFGATTTTEIAISLT